MNAAYPAREPFFAHRFVRVLTKSAAVQELGTEAAWLLTVVAHQEDAKRYSGPVTYWNEQLMPLCGFASKGRLVRARERAVAAGWLHYEPGAKGQPGRYWCQVPESQQSLTDGPCDESLPDSVPLSDGKRTANGRNADGKRTANGPHSTLTLIPVPEEGAADAAGASASDSKRRRQRQTPESMPLPDELDTPEARTALDEWRQHRREKRKPLTPTAERKLLDEWSVKGAARFVAAVNHSITSGWQGLFEPDLSRFPQESPVGQVAGSDALMRQHTAEALARNRAKLEAQRAARTTREGTAS